LLALGFGEAGSGIIAQNMNTGGDLNPMLPG
jgi:class 3 adenylate cyclase